MTIIYVTCASKKEAEQIGRILIQQRLAACVNIWPVRSIYRFKGKVQRAKEWALLCKTSNKRASVAMARIPALHSYDLPVVEQWKVATSSGVEQWLQESL